jgi:hypothetical protein
MTFSVRNSFTCPKQFHLSETVSPVVCAVSETFTPVVSETMNVCNREGPSSQSCLVATTIEFTLRLYHITIYWCYMWGSRILTAGRSWSYIDYSYRFSPSFHRIFILHIGKTIYQLVVMEIQQENMSRSSNTCSHWYLGTSFLIWNHFPQAQSSASCRVQHEAYNISAIRFHLF